MYVLYDIILKRWYCRFHRTIFYSSIIFAVLLKYKQKDMQAYVSMVQAQTVYWFDVAEV
jgi:hypothetical protein